MMFQAYLKHFSSQNRHQPSIKDFWLFEVQNYRAFVNLFHLLSQSPSSHAKTLIPNNTNIIMYMFYYASISEKNTKNKITENHCNTQISYIQILFGGRSQNGCVIKFLCFKVTWNDFSLCNAATKYIHILKEVTLSKFDFIP